MGILRCNDGEYERTEATLATKWTAEEAAWVTTAGKIDATAWVTAGIAWVTVCLLSAQKRSRTQVWQATYRSDRMDDTAKAAAPPLLQWKTSSSVGAVSRIIVEINRAWGNGRKGRFVAS